MQAGSPAPAACRLYTSVLSPRAEPAGVIYFVLGPEISSAELYPCFATTARAASFVTAVLHPRGSGYSDGLRGDIDDYKLILGDLLQGLHQLPQRTQWHVQNALFRPRTLLHVSYKLATTQHRRSAPHIDAGQC